MIAATNRDLRKAVAQGVFREDLYYQLQVFEIAIAPLRDRKSDVLPLVDAFLQDLARSFGRPLAGITADARRTLLEYGWPGNVRELRNALEQESTPHLVRGRPDRPAHLLLPVGQQPYGGDDPLSRCGRTADRRARDARDARQQVKARGAQAHTHAAVRPAPQVRSS